MEKIDKKVLTIQDISCVGQCSTTVALPIISSLGLETSPLPTSLLSNHTTGFGDFSYLDLTSENKQILEKFVEKNIKFDTIYTGYIGSINQLELITYSIDSIINDDGLVIVDPVMGDNGELYPGFNESYVSSILSLCKKADLILPNLTEACFLTGTEYKEDLDRLTIEDIAKQLNQITGASVVITGISFVEGNIGVCIYNNSTKKISYYFTEKIGGAHHGTGDVLSSTITALVTRGLSIEKSSILACNFVLDCVKATEIEHWYGIRFEACLSKLINKVENGNF